METGFGSVVEHMEEGQNGLEGLERGMFAFDVCGIHEPLSFFSWLQSPRTQFFDAIKFVHGTMMRTNTIIFSSSWSPWDIVQTGTKKGHNGNGGIGVVIWEEAISRCITWHYQYQILNLLSDYDYLLQ